MNRLALGLSLVFSVVCALSTAAQEPANPFKKAKAGDWVLYAKTVTFKGKVESESTVKMTVTEVADQQVMIEVVETVNGEKKSKKVLVDFTDRYYATRILCDYDDRGKVEKAGKEKVKVGDKAYECSSMTITFERVKGYPAKIKLWTSPEVPLEGIVKAEGEFTGSGEVRWELEACGRK